MNAQPPPHSTHRVRPVDPHTCGTDPRLTDQVPGDPPVPITVWRTARTDTDAGRSLPARLAYRLVAAYSRPGETVIDLTRDHALTAACVTGRRRHHPAWFTDAASLIIGPATRSTEPTTEPTAGGGTEPTTGAGMGGDAGGGTGGGTAGFGDREPPEIGAWFGDDLADPSQPPVRPSAEPSAVPPSGWPGQPSPDRASARATTGLLVAAWPLDAVDAANRVKLAWLLTACGRLLRPGGCLVLIVAVNPGTGPAGDAPAVTGPEDFGPVTAAAASVGLRYLQHIVAITADTVADTAAGRAAHGDVGAGPGQDADVFVYHVTDEELLALAAGGGPRRAMAHLRVHADLLVFSHAEDPAMIRRASRRRRAGGGRRG